MNQIVTTTDERWTPEQVALIKRTYAPNATDDEFKLFLYRAKQLELDPLKKQIYFVKYNNSPGTIVIGIDGYRAKAAKTGLHVGTQRGLTYDKDGKLTHGWCKVFRKDWEHPVLEEVSLKEYDNGRGEWKTRKETMIKKSAEIAALRIAFNDEFGGDLYDEADSPEHEVKDLALAARQKEADIFMEPRLEELKRADERMAKLKAEREDKAKAPTVTPPKDEEPQQSPAREVINHATGEMVNVKDKNYSDPFNNYVIPFGKHTNKTLPQLGVHEALKYRDWLVANAEKTKRPLDGNALTLCTNIQAYAESIMQPASP